MRMQRWVLGTLLVTWTAGCATPMPVQPATPAASVPMAAAPLSAPSVTVPAAKTPVAPTKAPVAPAVKPAATPAVTPVAPVVVAAPVVLDDQDLDPVMATANAVLPANLSAEAKVDLTTLAVLDEELTAKQLSASVTTGFATQGWFSDLKEKFNNWREERRLKKEAKKQLKDNDDFVAKQQATKISWLKKNRNEPTVTTNQLEGGGKEIISVWTDGKGPKTSTVTLKQVFDTEGVEQFALLTEAGQKSNDQTWETIRSRKLLDEDGTREVYTKRTLTDKKGRSEIHEFTRIIKADRTETISGTITNRNGKITKVSGQRSADGKLTIDPVTAGSGGTTPSATPDW
jgi:hypothetical protein